MIVSNEHMCLRHFMPYQNNNNNNQTTTTKDGNRLIAGNKIVSCSRWQELGDSLRWHGQVALALGAHTEFRMLNQTPTLKAQHVIIGAHGLDGNAGMEELEQAIGSTPSHGTPLCAALRSV
jgi:hypothetical protein